jgi:hypothetical protein
MMYSTEVGSCGMIFLSRYMKTGTDIQAILRFCLRKLRGYYVGITDEKKLLGAPLRWAQVA